jgi:hypothetical protein
MSQQLAARDSYRLSVELSQPGFELFFWRGRQKREALIFFLLSQESHRGWFFHCTPALQLNCAAEVELDRSDSFPNPSASSTDYPGCGPNIGGFSYGR